MVKGAFAGPLRFGKRKKGQDISNIQVEKKRELLFWCFPVLVITTQEFIQGKVRPYFSEACYSYGSWYFYSYPVAQVLFFSPKERFLPRLAYTIWEPEAAQETAAEKC